MSYFSRYVIDEKAMAVAEGQEEAQVADKLSVPKETLLQGFDPQFDSLDRRILYEVTGMRLNAGEYRGEDTSSDEEDAANAGQKKKKKGKKKVIDIE